jgi:hypothetical protein
MNEYLKQATDFLTKTNTTLVVEYLRSGKHFDDDDNSRDIYKCTLKRGHREYTFEFGQSIANSKRYQYKINKLIYSQDGTGISNNMRYLYPERFPKTESEARFGDYKIIQGEKPNAYDVLAGMQKYEIGTFEEFCAEFGYDTDSRKAENTYKAVRDEYIMLCTLFSPSEMEELQEIQ